MVKVWKYFGNCFSLCVCRRWDFILLGWNFTPWCWFQQCWSVPSVFFTVCCPWRTIFLSKKYAPIPTLAKPSCVRYATGMYCPYLCYYFSVHVLFLPSQSHPSRSNTFRRCPYWRLRESCLAAKSTYLIDNPATIFFATFMALWSAVFLILWKRKQTILSWNFDTYYVTEQEVSWSNYCVRDKNHGANINVFSGTSSARVGS